MGTNNLQAQYIQTAQVGTPETVVSEPVAKSPLGALIKFNDNVYRYVKFDNGVGNVAAAAAGFVYWKVLTLGGDPSVWTVTSDVSDSLAPVNGGAGVLKGVVTDLHHTWIGVGGVHLVQTAAAVVTGDKLYGHATTDLILTRNAVATATPDQCYGIALESVSATVASQTKCLLMNLAW